MPIKLIKRLSNEFEKTDESLYCTALEDVAKKSNKSTKSSVESSPTNGELTTASTDLSLVAQQIETKLNLGNHEVPGNVEDFDKENWNDIFQASHYAMDIFNYLKTREAQFKIPDYMGRQICLSHWMRSLLVDWMVEVQESFELNHETLYLGVKLVDMYLSKMTVGKETLQLVGAAAMFVASKYDERIPPMIDDFLYICGRCIHKARAYPDGNKPCAKITMPVLTLARFILEYSLMDYATVSIRDSILAAASLFLALRMKHVSGWTPTLEFYTGYKLEEIIPVVHLLNDGIHKTPKSQLMTVLNKYSHKIFLK
ncbi:hypothetical protein NQ317_011707 [Molorchus minor]|uniref:G2/mitotic-specific cyclin-B3 n=1 Tax=Molorchus minor TaxID=1323400 RepID=A0ABQ9JQT1_9CUCU|nr:hypothetical protein NQ317_011707 [Molorchus minor]